MDERDSAASETLARLGVDHLDAVGCKLADRRRDVGDLERDVVMPGPRLARKRPIGVSAPSGETSSTRPLPTCK